MHGLEIELVDLRHTEECEGYKSLDDIVQAIKKKFPDWYWAEED